MTSIVERVREQSALAKQEEKLRAAAKKQKDESEKCSFTRQVLVDLGFVEKGASFTERDGFIWLEGMGYRFSTEYDWEHARFGVLVTDGEVTVYRFIYAGAYRPTLDSTIIDILAEVYDEIATKHNPPPPPPPPEPVVKHVIFDIDEGLEAAMSAVLRDGWSIQHIHLPEMGLYEVLFVRHEFSDRE